MKVYCLLTVNKNPQKLFNFAKNARKRFSFRGSRGVAKTTETSKMESFTAIVNKPLTIVAILYILDVCGGPDYVLRTRYHFVSYNNFSSENNETQNAPKLTAKKINKNHSEFCHYGLAS